MASPVRVVLLRPRTAENLGAAARAMQNFGLREWVWVDPQVSDLEPARRLAVHAGDVLESARRAASLDEAVADCTWVVATSSRSVPGKRRLNARAAAHGLVSRAARGGNVALVFGDERSGLTNAEVLCCHALSAVPTRREQPSINLAQAVLLYAYELHMAELALAASIAAPHAVAATHAELTQLDGLFRSVLTDAGFLTGGERRAIQELMETLVRAELTHHEAELWLAALHTLQRGRRTMGADASSHR